MSDTSAVRHEREIPSILEALAAVHRVIDDHGLDRSFNISKAALAWTEALTRLDGRADLGALRATLREHMSEREIGALTAAVAMISLWNRIQISRH